MQMMQRRKSSPPSVFKIESFLGADLSQSGNNINSTRSPACPNMIRESPGKVRKWIGYHTVKEYPARINGIHFFRDVDGDKRLIHAGTTIYLDGGTDLVSDDTVLTTDANDNFSKSVQINSMLCFFDGKKYRIFRKNSGNYELVDAESIAYVPTTVVARLPSGGGTPLDPINLLSKERTIGVNGDGTTKVYQLPEKSLDADLVTVKRRNADGSETDLIETTDFTVNRTTGQVTFSTAPPVPVPSGEDNIFITYAKTVAGYADRINKCDICVAYGENGSRDRVFCAGNPDNINRDYFCAPNDPTYFGDLNYSILGGGGSKIMGYTVVSDKLATHLDRSDDDTNIILREASILNEKVVFRLAGGLQGYGAISKHSFATLAVEPVYASKQGIQAITMSDYSSERYAQNRSFYLDGMLQTLDLTESFGCVFKDFYLFTAGEYLFALDSLQVSRSKDKPYATRQYEGYYRTGINARVLWEQDNKLCFGCADGKIKEFHTDYKALSSYSDDGAPIAAQWATPEFYGQDFFNKKKFKNIAVLLGAAVATGCRIWVVYDGLKELVLDYDSTARYFSYSQFSYSKMSYKTDRTPQMIMEKLSGVKPDSRKVQFIFENDVLNEPFLLAESAIEFTEKR